MKKENKDKLRNALDNLYHSEQYRTLCDIVLELQAEEEVLDEPSIERYIDNVLICRGAWIYDKLITNRKTSMIKRVRKVLGYTYP